jgi:hypothetical protein
MAQLLGKGSLVLASGGTVSIACIDESLLRDDLRLDIDTALEPSRTLGCPATS